MGRIAQIIHKIHYRIKPGDSVRIARKIGVRFTADPGEENCRILSEPLGVFGSEPYLITIGKRMVKKQIIKAIFSEVCYSN